MCTFYSSLPKKAKSVGTKKRNLLLSMKPCPDATSYYRFRLLAFNSPNTDRDYPWIQRFTHVKWGTHPEKGYPMIVDQVTCPVTPHVHVEGNRYNACKMCDVANKYFIRFKESDYKDKEAGKLNKEFGRKLEYIIPVYVVNDPNYEANNGKFKVITFNDKKIYEEFKAKVEKQSMISNVFNGENAADCCIHVSEVSEIKNKDQPNEYTWKHKVYDKIVFTNRPYSIPSITKEAVDNMGFDDEYYTSSTSEEIEAFYKKWCTVSNDDIPEDDGDIPVYDAPKKEVTTITIKNPNPSNVVMTDDIPENDLEVLVRNSSTKEETPKAVDSDIPGNDIPSESPSTLKNDASSEEIDALLNGIEL